MTEATTLVTPEMEEQKGVWCNQKVSRPVSESDIRKWAIAAYWPETPPQIFWDADYAATTSFGGIVAPEDFNPFAWPVPREDVDPTKSLPGLRGGNIMNGGQTDTFLARIRPGDVITSRLQLADWKEREGKSAPMLFTYYKTEWHDQDGVLVRSRLATVIQF